VIARQAASDRTETAHLPGIAQATVSRAITSITPLLARALARYVPTAVLRQYERHYNDHRPHRTLGQPAPLRPLPEHTTTDLQRVRDDATRLGGLIHEYQQVA